jgi:hypothetical protein
METAKVDIRKLQLLNDRINQCIDALNQVRLSVHGLSHTSGNIPGAGLGQSPAFGGGQAFGVGFGLGSPYGQIGQAPPYPGGLSHTGAGQPVFSPFGSGFPGILQQQGWSVPQQGWLGQNPGLSHTSPEALSPFNDPFIVNRIAQTFPYAQFPLPAVVSLY